MFWTFGTINVLLFNVLIWISAIRCTHWDEGFDGELLGDIPVPTPEPAYIIPDYRLGSVPIQPVHLGRSIYENLLENRQSCNATQTLCTGYGCCSGPCCGSGCCTSAGSSCCGNGTGCCNSGGVCCGTVCCVNGWTCQDNNCVNPALSLQSVLSLSSLAQESSESVSSASLASASSASESTASVSSELNGQTRGNSDPNTVNTVVVLPSDPRIEYNPPSAWLNPATESGAGLCTNGTSSTLTGNSAFSFIFSGSAITLYMVPSTSGGSYSLQIDGNPPVNLNNQHTSGNQCKVSQAYHQEGMTDQPHEIVITNGNSGSLEFSGFVYTGKGAWGTSSLSSSSSPSSKKSTNTGAIIGGAVAGAIVLIAIVAIAVFFCVRRRRRNSAASNSPPSSKEPMFQYAQAASPVSGQFSQTQAMTHTGQYNQTPFTSGHSLAGAGAAAGVAGAGAYGMVSSEPSTPGYSNSTGLRYDPPSTWSPQNYSQPYQIPPAQGQGQGQGQGYDPYQSYERPQPTATGGTETTYDQSVAPIAPLAMTIERSGSTPQVSNAANVGPNFTGFPQYQYNQGLFSSNSTSYPNRDQ